MGVCIEELYMYNTDSLLVYVLSLSLNRLGSLLSSLVP